MPDSRFDLRPRSQLSPHRREGGSCRRPVGAALAANGTWNVNANGTWTNATNWVSSTIADGADSTAFFTFNITADRTVTLGANRTIGNITFTDSTTNSSNLTISGTDILTLDLTTGTPVIDVTQTARALTISSVIAGSDGLQKNGTGSLILSGNNTYTGVTRTNASGGTLQVSLLANGGSNSSIGASSNAAANLLLGNASVFRYAGSTNVTTDRGFTINGTAAGHGATVESSGTGTLSFDNTVGIAYGSANQTRTLTLGGTNTGNNTFGKVIGDNGTGAVTLAKSGTGTWVLNQSNTYTGITQVNATGGTLDVTLLANGGTSSSIGASGSAAANLLLGNAGTLRYTGSTNVTTNRSFTINGTAAGNGATISSSGSGTLSFTDNTVGLAYGTANQTRTLTLRGTNTGNNTFGKIIANNGTGATSLVKNDAGLWLLDQPNTYNGTTTVSAGTLRAGAAAGGQAFGNLSAVSLTNVAGAVLDLNGFNQTIGSLATGGTTGGNVSLGSATLTTGGLNTSTSYAGVISGSGGLTKTGAGTQSLTGTNTYTGPTLVSAGTLQIGNAGTTGSLSASTTITNNATLAFNRTNTLVVSNAIGGSGALVKLAAGTITLTGNNTYTGTTTISAGILQLGNAGATGALSPSSSITNNGTLAFSRTNTVTQGTDFASVIAGTGAVTKLSTGTLILNGTNTYTGATTITAGTLSVATLANGGANSNIGASTNAAGNLILNGGSLTYTGAAVTTDRLFSLQASSTMNASGTGALNFSNTGAMGFNGGTAAKTLTLTGNNTGLNTIAASIGNNTGTTSLIKSGTGRWALTSGTSSYTGITTISASGGTLEVAVLAHGGANSSIGASSAAATNLLLGNGTTLRYTGTGHTSNRSFTVNGTAAGNGATLDASGSGAVVYSGTTSPAYGTVNQTRALTLTGTSNATNTLAANIANNGTGAVSLTKTGAGLWVLSGNRTYTGTTTVSAGTLRLNGTHTGGGAYTVSGSGMLQGTGSTSAALSISGTLAPGASVGTFGSGALSMLAGSQLQVEVDSSAALGVAADLAIVSGNLNLTGTVNLTLADLAGSPTAFADNTIFTLVNYSGSWNGGLLTFAGIPISNNGTFTAGLNTWRLNYNATSGGSNFSGQYIAGSFVNVVAVPEPGSFLLLAAGIAAFTLIRRRK